MASVRAHTSAGSRKAEKPVRAQESLEIEARNETSDSRNPSGYIGFCRSLRLSNSIIVCKGGGGGGSECSVICCNELGPGAH